jgi:hypothetical protein
MKIQLPDKCPVCGAERFYGDSLKRDYKCGLILMKGINNIKDCKIWGSGNCADKVLIKFGTTEQAGNEEKENERHD